LAAAIETLENRTMLTATPVTLTGDAGASTIEIFNDGGTVRFFQNEPETATPTLSVPYADLGPVTINGGGGGTTVTLDYSGGDLFPNGLAFNGQSPTPSPNQLIVANNPSGDYTLGSGSLQINNDPDGGGIDDTVSFSAVPDLDLFQGGGTSSVEVTGGSFTFNSNLDDLSPANPSLSTTVSMTVDSGASVSFGSSQKLSSLTINTGGAVAMLPAGGQVLNTNTLTVDGTLDLANNDLIVRHPGTASMDALQQSVANWVNGTATVVQRRRHLCGNRRQRRHWCYAGIFRAARHHHSGERHRWHALHDRTANRPRR
jgi:hypothetical protein